MDKIKKDDFITTAKERFKDSSDAESARRIMWLEDMRFKDGEQWDDMALEQRKGRPCLTINKVAATSKRITGAGKQNRPGIKIRPFDSKGDVAVAATLTGIIKNINNLSNAQAAYDMGYDHAVNGGFGYWRILTEYAGPDTFDQDIKIKRITNPLSVYFDPWAEEEDQSDARWAFITNTLEREEFKERYPDATEASEWDTGTGDSKDIWVSKDTVQEVEYFYKKTISKKLFLLENGDSVFAEQFDSDTLYDDGETKAVILKDGTRKIVVNEREVDTPELWWCKIAGNAIVDGPKKQKGKYIPIVRCSGEESWLEGECTLRSAIHWAKEPARLYNWSKSNEIETLALHPKQPYLLTVDQLEGHQPMWDKARYTPMPYLLYNATEAGYPRKDSASMPDSGASLAAREAADDIKATTGVYDASLGRASNETSGKAIMARQTESDIAIYVFPDNLEKAIIYTGKILVDLIPKVYDSDRIVRIVNDDDVEEYININKATIGPDGEPMLENDMSYGSYDVVPDVDTGYKTKRLETAAAMSELLRYAPNTAPVIVPRLAKSMDWPDSAKISTELAEIYSPPPPQELSPQEKADLEKLRLDVRKKELEVEEQRLETEQEKVRLLNLQESHESNMQTSARKEILEVLKTKVTGGPTPGQNSPTGAGEQK